MDAIEIYNEPMEDEVLRVNLVYDSDGVKLVAVDQNGEPQKDGSICRITNDGKVFYYSGISEDRAMPALALPHFSNNAFPLASRLTSSFFPLSRNASNLLGGTTPSKSRASGQ